MRIFEEQEYEQPAVYRDRDSRDNSKRTSFYAEVQEAHEYDEEGLAERVVEEAEVPLVEPRDRRARSPPAAAGFIIVLCGATLRCICASTRRLTHLY
jgi:hypothetical protein